MRLRSSSVVVFVALGSLLATKRQLFLDNLCNTRVLEHIHLPGVGGSTAHSLLCQNKSSEEYEAVSGECETGAGRDCHYKHVEKLNASILPLLRRITRTAYFRYFKVNLFCDCPLWPDDGMCAMEACSVCECDDQEVPPAWRGEDEEHCNSRLSKVVEVSAVNRTLSNSAVAELPKLVGWAGLNNPWVTGTDSDVEYSYINLLVNPERYTGYQGEHAHRIWESIYSQNCFKNVHSQQCDEESLVFYRIISGVHASISMHIAREYLLDEKSNEWGINMAVFRERMADPGKCDHVRNLYFAYLFVVKAVSRAAPAFKEVLYHTGMPEEDAETQALMADIMSSSVVSSSCNLPFDLGRMWKGQHGTQLRAELQTHFQNITSIMDCVGCEKCKLWGKLQFLGVATALKILFASEDCFSEGVQPKQMLERLKLERNEVIALVNLLTKLAISVDTYRNLSDTLYSQEGIPPCIHRDDILDASRPLEASI